MKKTVCIVFLISGLLGCSHTKKEEKEQIEADNNQVMVNIHNARNSLDYQGVYTGTISVDNNTVDLTIAITEDRYILRITPQTEGAKTTVQKGNYTWDENGSVITLVGAEGIETSFFVGENHLRQATFILRKLWE